MIGRARSILSRFPSHLEAARDGKRLGEVTQALALDADTLSAALARVRRARRLLDADELRDLLRIAALHGITPAELAVLFSRLDAARELLTAAAGSDTAAEQLIGLWGIAEPAPRLPRFVPRSSVAAFAERALSRDVVLDSVRRRIGAIAGNHANGNGTVRALAFGAANALDLDVRSISHSSDRFVHTAIVEDRLRIAFPKQENGTSLAQEFEPRQERLFIEENPYSRVTTGYSARKRGDLFTVRRRGFDREALTVQVTGTGNRTVGPMLVNRDEGHGVGFAGAVPDGQVLEFTEEGRVRLDGTDVTSLAYAWRGACFAEPTAPGRTQHPADSVFDGPGVPSERRARFAESTPQGALGASFAFPHAGQSLPVPGLSVGETRFAFFIQEAHYSRVAPGPPEHVESIEPRTAVGSADQSVFAPAPAEVRPTAAQVALSWDERAAFRVDVWIPRRFLAHTPDDAEGRATLGHVTVAVNRFRPAGVHVGVKFQDDRWVLGRGVITGDVSGPGMGTELWSAKE